MATTPDRFVHPRQTYLWERLKRPLPEGAQDLVQEAIEEYQAAFSRKPATAKGSERINSVLAIHLPDDGGGNILAGGNKLLAVRFGLGGIDDERSLGETFTHLVVVLRGANLDRMNIYPDWLRYIAVDSAGNSKRTNFLLEVPATLRGYNGELEVAALNGANIIARQPLPISIR